MELNFEFSIKMYIRQLIIKVKVNLNVSSFMINFFKLF